MKLHKILKSFAGSQTGLDHHEFEEGMEAHLSTDLAAVAISHGYAEPVVVEEVTAGPSESIEEKMAAPVSNKMKKPFENKKKPE